ncbi:hypothetical protein LX15_000866 [Streptoalloteichus tenebrarius]|uniref:Tail sheath protein n=1 Tax=Streptoalloteichus tenebrarius (strain ATCC 17920 / DSM 40477 / JCM 4838 / CBS 697.72 / NBRC 16177 / NCIMB 11028 / NRRL B-12390 / A12253. 1 / ISP 5477) TaxID=1933 RepID=A0ABT1HNU3_STRSD|nr:phage tail sheath subtilisin-like domain-containing protein [Streptoalloteichus tenebrarius]MCP2257181.1 hypothetical protein [Streptoalloteichus tenebrarius]BFE98815.1 phage tail sheath family protein [Streptoalloteichus tenebrarius]
MTAPARRSAPTGGAPLGTHRAPGVRLEWLDAAPQSRAAVRTDVAGFVGIAERGPLHRAVRVDGWDQFRGVFGGHLAHAHLAYAVEGFFANGGSQCWVVRVADPVTAAMATASLPGSDGIAGLTLRASSPGGWGNRVEYRVGPVGPERFTLTLRFGEVVEVWHGLSVRADAVGGRDPERALNDPVTGSRLVTVAWSRPPEDAPPPLPGNGRLSGGADGLSTLRPEHFTSETENWGLGALTNVDDVALVSVPDCWPRRATPVRRPRTPRDLCGALAPVTRFSTVDGGEPPAAFTAREVAELQHAVLRHCERRADRVALLDAPPSPECGAVLTPNDVMAWRRQFRSAYGALYHPWLVVLDPRSRGADTTAVPPSGHVAGLCARTDRTMGVHRAPAGEVLRLAVDTTSSVDDDTHGSLNSRGVNVIRSTQGVRVLGARTLADADSEWRHLNVRRLMLALEKQITADTAWTVFEPNSPNLRGELERVVSGVLEDVWRSGRLAGGTREEAYRVRCDAEVNPDRELAEGRLTCLVEVNLPAPAEFVVLRVVRTPAGVQVEEPGSGRG